MRPELDGIWTINAAKKILPKIPQDVALIRGVTCPSKDARLIGGGTETQQRFDVKFPGIEPTGRVLAFGFPFGTIGARENEQRAQPVFIPAKPREFLNLAPIVDSHFGEFLEDA